MKKLLSHPNKYILEIIIFTVLAFCLFNNLGNYPNFFDSCVEYAVQPQIMAVFDNISSPYGPTWAWQDVYQHAGGRSIVYGGLIEAGFRTFGFSLLGLRFYQSVFAFGSLVLAYFTIKKLFNRRFAQIFTILLGTSPWYLLHARSGGIIGFGLILVTVAVSLTALVIKEISIKRKKYSWLLMLSAGISVAFLPYGHTSVRVFFIVLILLVTFYSIKYKNHKALLFFIPIIIIIALQIPTWQDSIGNFFLARGESFSTEQEAIEMQSKIIKNIDVHAMQLFGLNDLDNFWNPNLAFSYWVIDSVHYPRFLVPLFILGCLINIQIALRRRRFTPLLPILFLGIAMIPGVMAGIGFPNPARNLIMILPIYFLITIPLTKAKKTNIKFIILIFTGFVVMFQIFNFFTQPKGFIDEGNADYLKLGAYLKAEISANNTDKYLLIGEKVFYTYSYTGMRWAAGKVFEAHLKSDNIELYNDENAAKNDKLIKDKYFDFIIINAKNMGSQEYVQNNGYALMLSMPDYVKYAK